MQHIRAVCFDLDDTLWDMAPVIPRAEKRLYAWFASHCPRVLDVYTPRHLHQLRHDIGRRYPELQHDLSELRLRMLRQVLQEAGYDDPAFAEEAFRVFQEGRNAVELFADVLPALERLSATHALYAFTNGNASLHAIGIADLFSGITTAREVGVAKPDGRFFMTALQQSGIEPESALHVGDHPENDIRAAAAVGMATAWVNRKALTWQLPDCAPDHELNDLSALPGLLSP